MCAYRYANLHYLTRNIDLQPLTPSDDEEFLNKAGALPA